jgi:hypothetical protein
MVVGLPGANGVYVHRPVENRIDQENEHVRIRNQRITVAYVLDLSVKKKHVHTLLAHRNQRI